MTKQMTVELPDGVCLQYGDGTPQPLAGTDIFITTSEAADELIARVVAAKKKAARPAGMPEKGDTFFIIDVDGNYSAYMWNDAERDINWWNLGSVILTEAECLAEIERRKALQRVRQWIAEHTEPFEPVLKNTMQDKWAVGYDLERGGFDAVVCKYGFPVPLPFFFAQKADVNQCIAACEADLRVLAGVTE